MSDFPLKLERVSGIGFLALRGQADSGDFLAVLERIAGVELPIEPNTVNGQDTLAYWLGPDEWLLRCTENKAADLRIELVDALRNQHIAVNDLSGGLVAYRLAGSGVRELLATGCTLDLHPLAFAPGRCAQTGLAKAPVLLNSCSEPERFDIVVRRSFADYLWRWLARTGREFRIEVA